MADKVNFDALALPCLKKEIEDTIKLQSDYQKDWDLRFNDANYSQRQVLQNEFQERADKFHKTVELLNEAIHKRELLVQQLTGLLITTEIFIQGKKKRFAVRVLFDSGSEVSYISRDLVDKLKLTKIYHPTETIGIGSVTTNSTYITEAEISSKCGTFKQPIVFIVNTSKLKDHPLEPLNLTGMLIPDDIELSDTNFHMPGTVDVILGAKVQLHVSENRSLSSGQILMKSQFGWVVGGDSTPIEAHDRAHASTFEKGSLKIPPAPVNIDWSAFTQPASSSYQTIAESNKKRKVEPSEVFDIQNPQWKRGKRSVSSSKKPEKLSVLKVCEIIVNITKKYGIAAKFEKHNIDGDEFARLDMAKLTKCMEIDSESAT